MRGAIGRGAVLTGAAAALLAAVPASARPFRIGEVEGVANVELSYGLLARVEDRDGDLVAIANGGSAESANFDDGNLNYDEGVVSNAFQASGEVAVRYRMFGAYVRGIAFSDLETELGDRERTDLATGTDPYVGSNVALRDYHVGARLRLHGMPVQVRVGDQVLNWGESTFLRFGVQVLSPADVVAALRGAAAPRDLEIPQGMVWAAANLTEEVAVEAYYQYDWERVRTPPVGWYFSDTDALGSGGLGGAVLGGGRISDLGTDLDDLFELPAGTLGFDRDFMRIPGIHTDDPSDQGQGGVTLQTILPRLNSTKLSLHFVNYHSRLPVVGGRTADAAAVAATTPEAVADRAAALEPIYEMEGLPPAEAAAAAASAAANLAVGEYAGAASFFAEYPEDVQMIGVSFNTTTIRTGTLVSGEVSHHLGFPFQILVSDVLGAAMSAIEFDPSFGHGPLGAYGPDAVVSGVERLDKTQAELGIRQLLGARLGAARSAIGIDVGWVHVHDVPSRSRLRLNAPGITGADDLDHLPDADSWGYRVLAGLTYEGVLGGLTVQPYAAWIHDVQGTTPGPGGAFVEDRKAASVGLTVDYTNTWLIQLGYTAFFGAGRFNLLDDRDFVRFQLTWFY